MLSASLCCVTRYSLITTLLGAGTGTPNRSYRDLTGMSKRCTELHAGAYPNVPVVHALPGGSLTEMAAGLRYFKQ